MASDDEDGDYGYFYDDDDAEEGGVIALEDDAEPPPERRADYSVSQWGVFLKRGRGIGAGSPPILASSKYSSGPPPFQGKGVGFCQGFGGAYGLFRFFPQPIQTLRVESCWNSAVSGPLVCLTRSACDGVGLT